MSGCGFCRIIEGVNEMCTIGFCVWLQYVVAIASEHEAKKQYLHIVGGAELNAGIKWEKYQRDKYSVWTFEWFLKTTTKLPKKKKIFLGHKNSHSISLWISK